MKSAYGGSEYRSEVVAGDVAVADSEPVDKLFSYVEKKLIGELTERIRLVAPSRSAP